MIDADLPDPTKKKLKSRCFILCHFEGNEKSSANKDFLKILPSIVDNK